MTAPAFAGCARAAGILRLVRRGLLPLVTVFFSVPVLAASPFRTVTPREWQPQATVGILDRVTLRIHWHDNVDLLRATAKQHNLSVVDLHGFSILRRNTESGEWVCDVFVVRMRGALVDNDRTVTFGHEVLHCFGFSHD
jgi:hypothetical protein